MVIFTSVVVVVYTYCGVAGVRHNVAFMNGSPASREEAIADGLKAPTDAQHVKSV